MVLRKNGVVLRKSDPVFFFDTSGMRRADKTRMYTRSKIEDSSGWLAKQQLGRKWSRNGLGLMKKIIWVEEEIVWARGRTCLGQRKKRFRLM